MGADGEVGQIKGDRSILSLSIFSYKKNRNSMYNPCRDRASIVLIVWFSIRIRNDLFGFRLGFGLTDMESLLTLEIVEIEIHIYLASQTDTTKNLKEI